MVVLKAYQIANIVNGELQGDSEKEVRDIKGLEEADSNSLSFVTKDYLRKKKEIKTRAAVLLFPKDVPPPKNKTCILVDDPLFALVRLIGAVFKEEFGEGISPYAQVSSSAKLGKNVVIREFVVIEDEVEIKDNVVIMPFCFIGKGSVVGEGTVLFPHVTIYPRCRIGRNCRIHSGAVIGADGFGYFEKDGKRIKIPQIGTVVIEDDVEIGANTCIDRATFGATVVGEGVKIDNLVQIGHNVKIGKHSVLAGQVGIAGSVTVGEYVLMGGQVGIADHVRIGNRVKIAAKAGVPGNVKDDMEIIGSPAMPAKVWKRIYVAMKRLPEIFEFYRKLRREEK